MNSPIDIPGFVIAALGGAAVGLERQWSGHAEGPQARFAGIRTFTMLGAVGGFSGALWNAGVTTPAAILFAGSVAVIAAAYVAGSRQDVDGTTEVAALVVLAAGLFAGIGSIRLASGIIALVTLLLVEKSRLHSLVGRIDDVTLRSGVRFGVMALVVLPLLPEGPYGPFGGIRPRELWALVLFFTGLSFIGYLARRVAGPDHGYLVTGLLGGLVSSTNVTLTFARASRSDETTDRALAFGAVAANAMLYPRVLIATAILNPAVISPLLSYLAAPGLVAAIATIAGIRRSPRTGAADVTLQNPLQLTAALQMAVLFQIVLMARICRARVVGGVWCHLICHGPWAHRRGRAHSVDGEIGGSHHLPGHRGHRHRGRCVGEHRDETRTDDVLWQPAVSNDRGRSADADAARAWRRASLRARVMPARHRRDRCER